MRCLRYRTLTLCDAYSTVRRVIPRFVATSLLSGPIRTIGLGAELLKINFMVLIHDGSISTLDFVPYQPFVLFLNGSIPTIVVLAREGVS
jgi:hypothetical protein